MKNKKLKTYTLSIIIPLAVGGASALLTRNNMDIYKDIIEPPLSPPMSWFPVVWTILYILMGISSALIFLCYKDPHECKCRGDKISKEDAFDGLFFYAISLFLNFFWSIIFFNLRTYLLAFVWLVALWVIILKTITKYKKVCPFAAALQIPYLLWVAFAGYLTFGVYWLNM